MPMITDIEDYFTKGCGRCKRFDTPQCSAQIWRDGVVALRKLCLAAGLEETVKWAHPTYMHKDRNIAMIGAFQGDFRFSFLNATLLKDPEGVLEKAGPNAQVPSVLRFDSVQKVNEFAPIINAYIAEAMSYADKGIKPVKIVREIEMPEELTEALAADPELSEAFDALTPGRQKSYAFALNNAKKSETRIARIAKYRDKIIAGKGALDR